MLRPNCAVAGSTFAGIAGVTAMVAVPAPRTVVPGVVATAWSARNSKNLSNPSHSVPRKAAACAAGSSMDVCSNSGKYAPGSPGETGCASCRATPARRSHARPPALNTRLSAGHCTASSSEPSGSKLARSGGRNGAGLTCSAGVRPSPTRGCPAIDSSHWRNWLRSRKFMPPGAAPSSWAKPETARKSSDSNGVPPTGAPPAPSIDRLPPASSSIPARSCPLPQAAPRSGAITIRSRATAAGSSR